MALTEEQINNLPVMDDNIKAVAGKDTLLLIGKSTDQNEFLLLGGQRNNPLSRKADSIDATSKDSGDFSDKLPGMLSWSMSYEGLFILNDNAYEIVDYCYTHRKPVFIRQEYPDGSYRTGWATITQLDEDHSYNGVSTLKITLEGKGAISDVQTVDTPTIASPTITFSSASAKDATVNITPTNAFPRSITTSDGDQLTQDVDYTYSKGILTIKKEYLEKKKVAFTLNVKLTADVEVAVKATVSA